ncbi:MAG: lysostaphin resistance A-like protein [Parcubacteria group bacterium]|jgi:membrane protease YdiL (CAAX protease family)
MFQNKKYNIFFSDSHFLTSVFLIIACSILFIVFPAGNDGQKFTGQIFFLVLIPAAYIKFILKKSLSDYGLNVKNVKSGLFWGTLAMAIVTIGTYFVITRTTLANSYALPGYVVDNFWYFLLYELVFANISIFCLEFFLRGFVLFTFSVRFSWWAIFIQSLLYLFFLIYYKNSFGQAAYATALSTVLGFVAWRTRSIAYSYAIILISSFIIDAYLIHSIK